MARAATLKREDRHNPSLDLRAALSAIIERALVLLDQLDGDPDAEPSLCGMTVERGDDQNREDEDDNGVADHGELAWEEGGTLPIWPERILMQRVRTPRRGGRSASGGASRSAAF